MIAIIEQWIAFLSGTARFGVQQSGSLLHKLVEIRRASFLSYVVVTGLLVAKLPWLPGRASVTISATWKRILPRETSPLACMPVRQTAGNKDS
ncbi:hypothetical protein ETAA8_51910 [Anatilimnocola aggregata]|uniref:Uncharacterized protein n=1 Tax=Anatilimnocola aggregata TaxID=2528021 RepID=A0A517YIN2_9BACT|nr:hypothetical protein ETAA8_51910 [Anatilimnocola aggregata]